MWRALCLEGWVADNWLGLEGSLSCKIEVKGHKTCQSLSHKLCQSFKGSSMHIWYIPIKGLVATRSLYLYINPLPNNPIPSQIIGGTYVRVGSLCKANRRANHSHRVNFTGIKGGKGLNGKAKGEKLIYLWTIIYTSLSTMT